MLRLKGCLGLSVPSGIDEMVDAIDTSNALREEEGPWGHRCIEGRSTTPAHQGLNALTDQNFCMLFGRKRACARDREPVALRELGQAFKGRSTADEGPALVRKGDEDTNRPHGFQVLRSLWKRDRAHSGKNLS